MIEGVGQPADKRLTNILEKDTGREFLNFGSGSFGPLQYALMLQDDGVEVRPRFRSGRRRTRQ